MPAKYTYIDGVAVHYVHSGASTLPDVVPSFAPARTVLLVHGEGGNANTLHPQFEALADGCSPIALDFPGHGRSGGTESLKTISAYSELLAKLIRQLGLPPVTLVGHSLGAAAGLLLAASEPDLVRALVLVACPRQFEFPAALLDTWCNVMLGRLPQPFTMEQFSPKAEMAAIRATFMEQVKTDPRVRYFDLLACNQFDLVAAAARVRQPSLLIAGRDDQLVQLSAVEDLQAILPGARMAVVDEAGHSLPMEKPAAVNQLLLEFVGQLA